MASETPIENQSAIAWQPVSGSLQAMNMGSMPLGQLGQLVNWRNEYAYTIPDRKPWVDLPLAATHPGNAPAPAASASVEPTKPAEIIAPVSVPPPVAPPDLAAEATSLSVQADDAALEAAKAQELAEATAKAMASAAEEAAAKAKAAADQEAAEAATNAANKAAKEAADAKEAAAKEAAAKQVAETKAAADSERTEPPTPSTLSESIAIQETTAEPIPNPPRVPTAAKETKSAVAPKTNSTAATKPDSNHIAESQPTRPHSESLSLHLNEIAPNAPSNLRSLRSESSSDDYLLQLERLVLELNMELGRSRGEPKPVDPLEQMANRIIALNLENLALREKLQRTLNAS